MRYLLILLPLAFVACDSGFSDADMTKLKESIRTEYEKDGKVKVLDVQLIKESPRKVSGFARLSTKGFRGNSMDLTKQCTATMDEGGRSYIWSCN
jgi:hypothetical protein